MDYIKKVWGKVTTGDFYITLLYIFIILLPFNHKEHFSIFYKEFILIRIFTLIIISLVILNFI